MAEFEILKERWRDAKGSRTFQDIADSVDLSRNTVENAFQRATNPNIDTVIRISRELNVSIDDVCGIIVDKSHSATDLAQKDASHWKARYESAVKEIEYLRSITLFLAVFVLVVAGWAVTMDFRCTEIGFYRGQWTFGAVFSIGCLALAACLVILLTVKMFRRHKQKRKEKE